DAEIRRRGTTEHGKREIRRDGLDPPLEVTLVLLLGVGDPAERTPEVDPDPVRRGGAVNAGPQAGIIEGEPSGDESELAEPIELASGLGRHPGSRLEVVDLRGDLAAEWRRVEPIDALDRRVTCPETDSERVTAGPDRGDRTDPGDPDATALLAHAGGFVAAGAADSTDAAASTDDAGSAGLASASAIAR